MIQAERLVAALSVFSGQFCNFGSFYDGLDFKLLSGEFEFSQNPFRIASMPALVGFYAPAVIGISEPNFIFVFCDLSKKKLRVKLKKRGGILPTKIRDIEGKVQHRHANSHILLSETKMK